MKKKSLFLLSALIPLVFSSCSNDALKEDKKEQNEVLTSVSIVNKETLLETWTVQSGARFVDINTNQNLLIEDALVNGQLVITSNNESVVKVYGQYLYPQGIGTAKVSVTINGVSDFVNVTISNPQSLAPTLIVQGDLNQKYSGTLNTEISIPTFACVDYLNHDISSHVTVTSDKDPGATYDATNGTFLTTVGGTHTITYKVVDPNNSENVSIKTITLVVDSNYLGSNDNTFTLSTDSSGKSIITSSNGGFGTAKFNINPSKYYYCEATIQITPTGNGYTAGMAHYIENVPTKWLSSVINGGDTNWNLKEFDSTGEWSMDGGPYSWQLFNFRFTDGKNTWGNNRTTSVSTVKYAIARDDNMFYTFINDHVVAAYGSNYYGSYNTIPGIFGHNFRDGKTTYSDIYYFSSKQSVLNKIDEIYSKNLEYAQPYRPNSGWNASLSDLKLNAKSTQRGINFDYLRNDITYYSGDGLDYDNIVSPYVYFADDFTFEFDYKFDNSSQSEGRMWLEATTALHHSGTAHFEFGSKFGSAYDNKGGGQTMMDLEAAVYAKYFPEGTPKYSYQYDFNNSYFGENGLDTSSGLHYKLVSDLTDTYRSYYLEISSIANKNQVLSRTINFTGDNWDKAIKVWWKNRNCAGKYSNITFKASI